MTDLTVTTIRKAIIYLGLAFIFLGGYWTRGYLDHSGGTSDTTSVSTPIMVGPSSGWATAVPTITEKLKVVKDTSEARKLRAEAQHYRDIADSLMSRPDSLRQLLPELLMPSEATMPVTLPMSFTNFPQLNDTLTGSLWVQHLPLERKFGYRLEINPLNFSIPLITHRDPWWVKPALVLTTATAVLAVQDKDYLLAAGAGGASILLVKVNF